MHRSEDRRARADHDTRLAARDPLALVAALCVGQPRVQDRDRVAETRAEAADGLRRQGDLGDEHDRPEPALERRRRGLEVDLGLAAAGRAVEQEVAAAGVECGDNRRHRRDLVVAQPLRLGLALERLPLARRRLLLAPGRPHRRDELERPRRCRAVVLGEPEREIHQRRRQLVHDLLDRPRVDTVRRRLDDVHDHPARAATPERHRDDRALARAVRQLVGELAPAERARGDERDYGAEAQAVET